MHENRYNYYAFISYSHKDEKWAKWLQRKLENYRLPSAIRKESEGSIPKHIRPVFRDKTDISVGQTVRNNLRQELTDSRYLIVVCSPESAKSGFVDLEIRNFQEMGRGDRIIPFIVRGTPEPQKPGELQCYPPSLLQGKDTMLGASLQELSPNEALIKIIAAILGLKYDHLWQRHKRRQRFWSIACATALCLLLSITYGGLDYFFIVHTRYYDDYVEHWGVPEGLDRLSPEQVSHRAVSWRLETLRGQPRRLSRVDSAGNVRPVLYEDEQDRPDDQRYYYGENGRITYVDEYTSANKFVKRREYTQDLDYVRFRLKSGLGSKSLSHMTLRHTEEGALSFVRKKTEISAFHYQYDQSGLVLEEQYATLTGGSRADANGVFGQRFQYTPEGRIKSIIFLDSNDHPLPVRGVLEKRYHYTPEGYLAKIEWLDANGRPVFNPQSAAWVDFAVDTWGNRTHSTFYAPNGKPCFHKDGYANVEREYDAKGHLIKLTFRDTTGERCFSTNKVSTVTYKYNPKGLVSREAYFDTDGQPCYDHNGFSIVEKAYDTRGNAVFETFFGTDGKPCLGTDGYAFRGMAYDASGNLVKMVLLGIDGKPCLGKLGYSIELNTYDKRGDKIKAAYFDQTGQPCLTKSKFSTLVTTYDEQGNPIKETSLGVDGRPCLSETGFATSVTHYDANGNEIQQNYYDVHGNPCLRQGHFAILKLRYDEHENISEEAFFGVDGRPRNRGDGVAALRREFDKFGNVAKITFFGIDTRTNQISDDVFIMLSESDQRGNIVRLATYDRAGHPRALSTGEAIVEREYDARGHLIKSTYFGLDGRPYLHNGEYAMQKWTYDARGNVIKEAYYGIDGSPCLNHDGIAGWKDKYDARGNKISHTTFGLEQTKTTGVQMVRIGEVAPQGQAALHGIRENDTLFEFCYWHWDNDKTFSRLQNAIDTCKTYSKRVVTVSQDGQVHAFEAPIGLVGMELHYVTLPDSQAAALRASYAKYRTAADSE